MKVEASTRNFFQEGLYQWFEKSHRPLPWKDENDPYIIWLSEIILQQTRVEQGLPYFRKFLEKYPTIHDLASAPRDEVMKLWEGLGYYSRARNMHYTARYVVDERDGIFPDTYEEIIALKGVGPYTAAAIASFAFQLPHAVVDGNVYRILSRFFGIDTPIDKTEGKKLFANLAGQLLDRRNPGRFNQAMMDFGATHCTPANPQCQQCPLRGRCKAHLAGNTGEYPRKSQKISRRDRHFHFLVINIQDDVLIRKRTGKDIWHGLYEFPLVELPHPAQNENQITRHEVFNRLIPSSDYHIAQISRPFRQLLTHQRIFAVFWEIHLSGNPGDFHPQYSRANRKNLSNFAFPKIIDWYLQDNSLYLKLL